MEQSENRDYYADLGVAPSSSPEEIARAYRRLARASHPDLHPHDTDANQRFKAITEAYQVLSEPEQRAQYDFERAGAHPAWSPVQDPAGAGETEQPAPYAFDGSEQREHGAWTEGAFEGVLHEAANQFANELRGALLDFGEELESLSQSFRGSLPGRRGRQGFPPAQRPSAPPHNGRPPHHGKSLRP